MARSLRPASLILGCLALLAAGSLPAQHSLTGELPKPAGAQGPELVVVFGATGRTGRLVLAELQQRSDLAVRAVARDPDGVGELKPLAQWVAGDVTRADTLAATLRGARYVICTVGATERSGPNSPEFVDYGGVRNLADAAREAGVSQFVLVSSMGVESGGGFVGFMLNLLSGDALKWKLKGEEYLQQSGVPYSIVRPGGLTDKPGGGTGIRFQQGDQGMGAIPRADVAAVVVASVRNPDALNRTFEILTDKKLPVGGWPQQFQSLVPTSGASR